MNTGSFPLSPLPIPNSNTEWLNFKAVEINVFYINNAFKYEGKGAAHEYTVSLRAHNPITHGGVQITKLGT